jgi:uncharacterized protein
VIEKPDRVFARDFEWRHLARFAGRAGERPQLGVISGRRRQGKTFLVEALAHETGGFWRPGTARAAGSPPTSGARPGTSATT